VLGDSLHFLEALIDAPSPSGHEERAAELYREYTRPFAHDVRTDVHGNVYAILNPDAPLRIMLAGHMDEIGFMVHFIDDDGLLYFSGVGDHDDVIPVGQRVWVHGLTGPVPGVIGSKPIHLMDDEESKKRPTLDDLWIDIGVSSREEAETLLELGDVVTFEYGFRRLAGDRAVARGFDNKMGAYVVAEALRSLSEEGGLAPDVGVYAVATVQEEVGFRGAQTAAYTVGAKTGLAVDVGHATDYPSVSKQKYGRLEVGKGPTIARGANINPIVYRMLIAAAKEESIPYQVDVEAVSSDTDATVMQVTREGMATGLLGVAVRYMHTPCELLSLTDVEGCARLMAAYCRRVRADTNFTPRVSKSEIG
jgi:putative aminopeptidase FrvX